MAAGGGPVDGETLRVVARDEEIVRVVDRLFLLCLCDGVGHGVVSTRAVSERRLRRRRVRDSSRLVPKLEKPRQDDVVSEPRGDVRDGLVADGPRVYFGAERDERVENLDVPELGGAVQRRRARTRSAVHELVRRASPFRVFAIRIRPEHRPQRLRPLRELKKQPDEPCVPQTHSLV